MTEQEKQKMFEGLRDIATALGKSIELLGALPLDEDHELVKPDASKPREYRKVGTERETRIVDLLKSVHAGGGITADQLASFTGSTKNSVYTALCELKTKYDIVERKRSKDNRVKFFSIAN
jgi:hypothetical protein